jgi:hypothetical protein
MKCHENKKDNHDMLLTKVLKLEHKKRETKILLTITGILKKEAP